MTIQDGESCSWWWWMIIIISFHRICCGWKKRRLYKLLNTGIITRRSYSLYRNILTVLGREWKQFYYKRKKHLSRNNSKETWNILNGMFGRKSNRKQISLAVNDVILTGIQTINNFNTYITSVASDLVKNLSNNNNDLYGDNNNLNATCVLRETR